MQSHNYVPGVSGWKMHSNGTLEVEGKVRAIMVEQAETPELPFSVQGDQVILSEAFVDASKMSSDYSLKLSTNAQGHIFCAGIGVGIDEAPAEKVVDALGRSALDDATDASKVLDRLLGSISETELSEGLKNFNLEDFLSELKKDVVTRDDAQLPGRIKTLEACVVQLNSEIGRLVVAVSSLASGSAKQ